MQKILLNLAFFLFVNLSFAQTHYYSVQLENEKYDLYSEIGQKMNDKPHDWIEFNAWGWIFLVDSGLATALDPSCKNLGIDGIEEMHHVWIGIESIPLKKNGRWGYYSREGNQLIPHLYDDATLFRNGKAAVLQDGNYFYIDQAGKKLAEKYEPNEEYEFVNYMPDMMPTSFMNMPQETFVKKQKTGLKDAQTGKILIEAKYDGMYNISSKNVIVALNGKFGVVDFTGKEIIPVIYKMIYLMDFSPE